MDIELFNAGLRLAIPILIAALGELVVERSGIINISIEGMMLIGAFFSFWGVYATGVPWLGLLIGVIAAVLMALLFGVFTISLPCDQIIVGTAINLLALGLTGSLFRYFFGFKTTAQLPQISDFFFESLFWFLPLLLFIFINRTYPGLALKAAGEVPRAVETMGRSVRRIRFAAILFGGVCAGLAGAYLSVVHANTFVEGMTGGRGFIALAIVIFGRWHPFGLLAASLFFGCTLALQYKIQALDIKVPYQVVRMLPFALTLLVLALFGQKRGGAPKALGIPYEK